MKTFNIVPTGYTKSLLIAFYASISPSLSSSSPSSSSPSSPSTSIPSSTSSSTAPSFSTSFLDGSHGEVTSYMFSNSISACATWKESIDILRKACVLHKADEAVFTIAARNCVRDDRYPEAFSVIDAMLRRGLPLNKYSFSFVINACLQFQLQLQVQDGGKEGSDKGVNYLSKYINIAESKYFHLLTNAVCQKIMKDLLLCGRPVLAASIHLNQLSHTTCKSDTLGFLLRDLQIKSEQIRELQPFDAALHNSDGSMRGDYRNGKKEFLEGDLMAGQIERNSMLEEETEKEKERRKEGEITRERVEEMRDIAEKGLALVAMYCSVSTSTTSTYGGISRNVSKINANSIISNENKNDMDEENKKLMELKEIKIGIDGAGNANEYEDRNDMILGGEQSVTYSTDSPVLPRRHLLRITHFNRWTCSTIY